MINMDKLFDWGPDTRTEKQKQIDIEYGELLEQYEDRFKEQLNTEVIQISNEQLIKDFKRCLEEGITLDKIYPGLNDYDEEDDL